MSFLEIKGLSKSFGGLRAVNRFYLSVGQGEIVGLIGPNGAGKTTIFNVLTGVFQPDEGDIYFLGASILGLKPHQICARGMVRTFQIVKPFATLSVLENVVIGALSRTSSMEKARREAAEIVDKVGLGPMVASEAAGLPLAYRKRLELARALATKPKLLLLDEVMAGLNPSETNELIVLLREINCQGITMVMIEHVMKGVMALCQRIAVLNYGKKIAEGPPERVVKERQVIEAYLGEDYLGAQGK